MYDRYVQTNIDQLNQFENVLIPVPDHYYLHYLTGFKIFKDHPIIGIGPNMFRKYCNKDSYFTEASKITKIPELTEYITGVITS